MCSQFVKSREFESHRCQTLFFYLFHAWRRCLKCVVRVGVVSVWVLILNFIQFPYSCLLFVFYALINSLDNLASTT